MQLSAVPSLDAVRQLPQVLARQRREGEHLLKGQLLRADDLCSVGLVEDGKTARRTLCRLHRATILIV